MSINKSFTLIELLVVIVIIGILAGVIMISTSSSIDKANFAKAQAFSSTVQEEMLSSLISEWTFNEDAAPYALAKDTWSNNDGIVNEAAYKSEECVVGSCYSFDGVNDYIRAPHSEVYNFNEESNFTMSIWIKIFQHPPVFYVDGVSTHRSTGLFLKGHHAGSFGIQSYHDNVINDKYTRLSILSGIRNRQLSFVAELNTFYHVVLVYKKDGSDQIIDHWINGKKISSSASTTILTFGNTLEMSLGDYRNVGGNGYYPNGILDEARIYNSALSAAQIKQNYIAGLNSMLSNGSISKKEYNERLSQLSQK